MPTNMFQRPAQLDDHQRLTLLSLSAPLSGHGISGADRLALAGMHVAVAAVLNPAFAATVRPRWRNDSPGASQRSQAAPPGHAYQRGPGT